MDDVFQIGSARFEFAEDSIVAFEDGGMRFELRAVPVDGFAPGFRSKTFHFSDKSDEVRRVATLPVVWPVVDDFYLWEEGFDFGAIFAGQVTVTPDRVELRGDVDGVPVHIVRAVEPEPVTPVQHLYGSIGEALSVPAERVRRILFRDWDGRFPHEIAGFTNLEFLSLESFGAADPATEVPGWIGDLSRLTHIYLRSPAITRLPERIGDLRALEVLSVQYCRITELPERMSRLGNLQRLLLDGNQLTTLPPWVGRLPALTQLSIDGNPFTSLPDSLTRIDTVRVEKKYEALFRDISYRPELAPVIDREQFLARSSPQHVALLSAALARHGLEHRETVLLGETRKAVRLRTTEPDEAAVPGGTRIGGLPDLPDGLEYPRTDGRFWHFYAQLDLAELAPLQPWLPRYGRLYFFGEGQERGDQVQVLYSDAPAGAYRLPEDAEFTDGQDEPFPGFRVQMDATVSVPNLRDEDDQDAYWDLEEELTGNADRFRGAHTLNAFVFTQHESPQEQASRDLGGLPQEWIPLLTLASDGNPGFCFWDAGTFTFCIHEKDLAVGDFTGVHWSLESS